MTKQIRAYLAVLERYFADTHTEEENEQMRAELLQRIKFYQHERLIHLIVTMSFGVFFMLSLILYLSQGGGAGLLLLTVLFLVMLAAYIKHYYFLENSVQNMYLYYYRIGESITETDLP